MRRHRPSRGPCPGMPGHARTVGHMPRPPDSSPMPRNARASPSGSTCPDRPTRPPRTRPGMPGHAPAQHARPVGLVCKPPESDDPGMPEHALHAHPECPPSLHARQARPACPHSMPAKHAPTTWPPIPAFWADAPLPFNSCRLSGTPRGGGGGLRRGHIWSRRGGLRECFEGVSRSLGRQEGQGGRVHFSRLLVTNPDRV